MGNELTAVSIEQLRTLAERIRQAKAGAIGAMKDAIEAMHEQGTLLVQAELELGAAFDGWVNDLADHGVDPMQARYCMKIAKKHKEVKSLFSDPGAAKQLVLQNFAPPTPPKEQVERATPDFTLSFHLNSEPLGWSKDVLSDFLAKARPVVQLAQELEG